MNRRVGESGVAQIGDVFLTDRRRFARERHRIVDERAVARRRQCRRQIVTGELTESLSVMLDSVMAVIGHRNRDGNHLSFGAR
jgi:hypothetical protein